MSKVQIKVKSRDLKIKAKKLVRDEIVPGVVYDQKTKSQNIEIPLGILERFLLEARQGQLIEIQIDENAPKTAIFKELQMDVRTNSPRHISFMVLEDKVQVDMPVRILLEGEAPAVKNSLGVMIQTLNSIVLRGYPKDFPDHLSIEVSTLLDVGDSLDMTSIKVPENLTFIHEDDKELTVVTIRPFQKAIEEEKPVAAEGEELVEGEEGAEGVEGEAEAAEEGTAPSEDATKGEAEAGENPQR